jgi:hypothetical protein
VSPLPTWGEILKEIKNYIEKEKKPPFDFVRRKYLKKLYDYTERNVILYATAWTQKPNISPNFISITDEDIQGFMEVIHSLEGDQLDIILHSPGGFLEATEALVTYLRTKFSHIRIIVPYAAMSAATMLSCSANEIVMGNHSFLGPIDPQMSVRTRAGQQSVPAEAITEQFDMAKDECKSDPKNIGVWLPIIEQYGPALLKQCEHASQLSKELVARWLKTYMFSNIKDGEKRAAKVADKLSNHSLFKSHARKIGIAEARKLGLRITSLEKDKKLQDLVLSVFHSTTHTFDATIAVKIIENHLGFAFIKKAGIISPYRRPQIIKVPKKPTGS